MAVSSPIHHMEKGRENCVKQRLYTERWLKCAKTWIPGPFMYSPLIEALNVYLVAGQIENENYTMTEFKWITINFMDRDHRDGLYSYSV